MSFIAMAATLGLGFLPSPSGTGGLAIEGNVVAASVVDTGDARMFGNLLILTTQGKYAFVSIIVDPWAAHPELKPTSHNRAVAVLQVAILISGKSEWKMSLKGLNQLGVPFWYVFHKTSSMTFGGSSE